MKRITLHIHGHVQGVFYRKYAKQMADNLQLTGYITNREDGFVKCVIEGESTNINDFLTWAWRGSPSAQVEDVIIMNHEEDIVSEYKEFTIKNT